MATLQIFDGTTSVGAAFPSGTRLDPKVRRAFPRMGLVQCELGDATTVTFQGKVEENLSYVTITAFTANSLIRMELPPIYRATCAASFTATAVWVSVFD